MFWWIAVGVVVALFLALVWGIRRLRYSTGQVQSEIGKVTLADIERLREECRAVFRTKFSEKLSLDDIEQSARLLSQRVDDDTLKAACAKDDFWWYFVLPAGAFLGELLRIHAKGEWKASPDGGLEMTIPLADGSATTYPFDKILKQATMGDKGDLYAYLKTAIQLEAVVHQ